MGCIQSREENKARLAHNKTQSFNPRETFTENTRTHSARSSIDQRDNDEFFYLKYAEHCYQERKWEMLSPLLINSTYITSYPVSLSWSEPPKTVSSVALIFLGKAVQKYTVQVSPYIEVFLSAILAMLKTGSLDLKEHSVFLMSNYIEFASDKAIEKVLASNIFNVICRWMLSPKAELRKLVVNLCYRIYKNRPKAKEEFIKAHGAFYIVQLIGWNNSSDFLEELIRGLEEIIMENRRNLVIENLVRTKEPKTQEILSGLDMSSKSLELRNLVEKLVNFYKTIGNEELESKA